MSFPQGSQLLANNLTYLRTYNAGWFGGLTNEQKITNAIASAVADGMLYVFIPGSMLPYNATLVTFNSAIKLTCEGSNPADYDVRAYGADSKGLVDATAAMQAAHNTGKLITYPAGIYLFSLIPSITSGGIRGDGCGQTMLVSSDITSANLITYTSRLPIGGGFGAPTYATNIPMFKDFTLIGNAGKVAGAGIQFNTATRDSEYAMFDNVTFYGLPIGLDFIAASLWKVVNCNFLGYTVAGMQIANTYIQDAGDSVVANNLFAAQLLAGPSIIYKSSAGLKVIGNKMNVGTYGLKCLWTGLGSGDLLFIGNSVENMSVAGVSMITQDGTSRFHNLQIIGNEFSVCQDTIVIGASVALTTVISNNVISMATSGVTSGVSSGLTTPLA